MQRGAASTPGAAVVFCGGICADGALDAVGGCGVDIGGKGDLPRAALDAVPGAGGVREGVGGAGLALLQAALVGIVARVAAEQVTKGGEQGHRGERPAGNMGSEAVHIEMAECMAPVQEWKANSEGTLLLAAQHAPGGAASGCGIARRAPDGRGGAQLAQRAGAGAVCRVGARRAVHAKRAQRAIRAVRAGRALEAHGGAGHRLVGARWARCAVGADDIGRGHRVAEVILTRALCSRAARRRDRSELPSALAAASGWVQCGRPAADWDAVGCRAAASTPRVSLPGQAGGAHQRGSGAGLGRSGTRRRPAGC